MYWEVILWLQINGKPAPYPVFNERAVRATAGIMLLIGCITFVYIYSTKNYSYLYPTVITFWIQFLISVVRWPRRAPFSMLGTWVVSKQRPEYVWAIQKRFAWSMWLGMATAMLIITAWFDIQWFLPFAICMTCLFFMWMESTLGICVGCKIYYGLITIWRNKKPEHAPACPGWSCEIDG